MAAYYNAGYQYPNPYQQVQVQQPQVQSSGVIAVRNEMEARNYPIAPGNSIMFKDETAPYVYVKTMGISQFDSPAFDKFRLVKEDASAPQHDPEYALKSDLDSLREEIESLKKSKKEGKEK